MVVMAPMASAHGFIELDLGAIPDGLANSSGELGCNLMLHPYATVDGIFDQPVMGRRAAEMCRQP